MVIRLVEADAVAGDSITELSNDQDHGFAFASALQHGTDPMVTLGVS